MSQLTASAQKAGIASGLKEYQCQVSVPQVYIHMQSMKVWAVHTADCCTLPNKRTLDRKSYVPWWPLFMQLESMLRVQQIWDMYCLQKGCSRER